MSKNNNFNNHRKERPKFSEFSTQDKIVAIVENFLDIIPVKLLFAIIDHIIAHAYWNRPVWNTLFHTFYTTQHILNQHLSAQERKQKINSMQPRDVVPNLSEKQKQKLQENNIPVLTAEIAEKFDFLQFYAFADNKEKPLKKLYENILFFGIGLFPAELIKKHIKVILIKDLKISDIPENTSPDTEITITLWSTSSHNKMVIFYKNAFSALPKEHHLYEDFMLYILPEHKKTITHEITHAIFQHHLNNHWIARWKKSIGKYDQQNQNHFAREYGQAHIYEDMATIAEEMFSQKDITQLYKKAELSPVLSKKIEIMKSFFQEISQGQMDENYWQKIANGEIKNAIDAQEHFDEIKSKKKSSK